MSLQKLLSYAERFEDPNNPLLGPTIKGLYFFGLWQTGTKFRTISFNCVHITSLLFTLTEIIDLYNIRNDLNLVLNNMSLAVVSVICVNKTLSYVLNQKKWRMLVREISQQELKQIEERDKITIKLMKEYTKYTRAVTYLFYVMVFVTNLLLIMSPFLKYVSKSYRDDVSSGKEPLPQILFSWFPFDNKQMPGYIVGILVHIFMGCQGSGVIAVFDMNAVAVMSYLKGQTIILKERCKRIFEGDSSRDVVKRIRECHELHNVLVKHYRMFNALLSPTMFLYVLVCSITICGSVVQFTSGLNDAVVKLLIAVWKHCVEILRERKRVKLLCGCNKWGEASVAPLWKWIVLCMRKGATTAQKLWVLQYTSGLVSQLFLYCWHSNEVAAETKLVDRGVYESDWWKGDKTLRRQALLLAGKLDTTLILDAGPYTTLSVLTFIEIMKRSYSFFTLFSQMQYDE